MDAITEYLLSITAAGVLCAVVRHIGKHSSAKIIQAICGVFMAITIFSPVIHIKFNSFEDFFMDTKFVAEETRDEGLESAASAMAEIIKQQSEAYILDKAVSLGVNLDVKVKMSDTNPPVPKEVILSGNASPYMKNKIGQYITANFGISEENQRWI